MKKFFAWLLCLSFLLSLPVAAAEEQTQPLLEVTLDTFSNKQGIFALSGLYRDNVFYISPEDICAITGATVDAEQDGVAFRLHQGLRLIRVSNGGRLTESHSSGTVNVDIPVVTYQQKLYISAPDILSYMGAVVDFGANAAARLHMMVSMPYTVLDLLADYGANGGYGFSWTEAQGHHTATEDLVMLEALDTVLLGYDPNVIAYALSDHAENPENTVYADALLELLRTEGAELNTQEAPEVAIFGGLTEDAVFSLSFLEKNLEWVAGTELEKQLSEKWSDLMDKSGLTVALSAGCVAALEAARQFANLSGTQKTLLQDTLCRVSKYTDPCTRYPGIFDAAGNLNALIAGKFSAGEQAAWDQVYELLGQAAETIVTPNPISFAVDTLAGITGRDPLPGPESDLTLAGACADIRMLADGLLAADMARFDQNGSYAGKTDTAVQETMKQDMILSLKASLTARRLLLDTGLLSESAQNAMQEKARQTALLLNMAQNARPGAIGVYEENRTDISWIAELAPSGSYGHVVAFRDRVYYWRYNEESFRQTGTGSFQFSNTFNQLVCRDEDGNEEVLLTLDGDGAFVIANNWLFYENTGSQICSVRLDGTGHTNWGYGYLQDVTENGSYVIYSTYSQIEGNHLRVIDVAGGTEERLTEPATFVTYHDGVVYFTEEVEKEQAQLGKLRLCSIRPDGTDYTHLYTTEPDLYVNGGGFSAAGVDQIRFTGEYIYFSYGSVAGSGAFFQGARVIRVRYDGTGGQVVAGQTELLDGQFAVDENDRVTTYPSQSAAAHTMGNPIRIEDGCVYLYDRRSGQPTLVISPGDYDAVGTGLVGVETGNSLIMLVFAQQVDGKVYYLMHEAVLDTDPMASWREPYLRNRTVLLMKDLQTGQVCVLFQC